MWLLILKCHIGKISYNPQTLKQKSEKSKIVDLKYAKYLKETYFTYEVQKVFLSKK